MNLSTRQLSYGNGDSPNPEARTGLVPGITREPGAYEEVDETPAWRPSEQRMCLRWGDGFLSSTPFLQPALSGEFFESLSFSTGGDQTKKFAHAQLVLAWINTPSAGSLLLMRLFLVPFSLMKCGVLSILHLGKMAFRFRIIVFILPGYLMPNNSN